MPQFRAVTSRHARLPAPDFRLELSSTFRHQMQPTAESLEGRPETKENDLRQRMRPTQCGYRMSQGLKEVRPSRLSALTPFIQGRSRMREIRSYGSARGVVGDCYPYRDSQKLAAEVPRSVSRICTLSGGLPAIAA